MESVPDSAPDEAGRSRAHRSSLALLLVVLAVVILALDQLSKAIALKALVSTDGSYSEVRLIGSILTLRLAYNSGAAFSLATNQTLLLSLFSICVAAFIFTKARFYTSRPWVVGAGLIMGGIFGNTADRLFRYPGKLKGEVVDWIHLSHWPTFNLADSSIVVGAALIVALIVRGIPSGDSRQGLPGEKR